jgi:hypothetical protein
MRSAAWLASAVAHAGVAVWLALGVADQPRPFHPPALPAIAPRPPSSTAIDVDLIAFATTPSHDGGHGGGSRSIGSFAASPTPSPNETGTAPSPTPSPGTSSLLHMRALDLRVHDEALVPAQRLDEPVGPSRIAWSHDGTGVVHDRVTTMHVDPDGTAHLQDAPDFNINLPLPSLDTLRHLPSALRAAPGELEDAVRSAPAAVHEAMRDWYKQVQIDEAYLDTYDRRQHLNEIPNGCADYADLNCIDPDVPPQMKLAPAEGLISGQADVSSWLERKLVGDPYASRKKKLLEATFAERAEHGKAYRADQLVHAAERMRANLEELWTNTRDAATRKRIIFDLWDECTDDDAGQRARAIVMLWIQERLPPGSTDAYTPDELAVLATSGFAPYR